jgi:hypothetical protein
LPSTFIVPSSKAAQDAADKRSGHALWCVGMTREAADGRISSDLIDGFGISEELARRVPEDAPTTPPPGSQAALASAARGP